MDKQSWNRETKKIREKALTEGGFIRLIDQVHANWKQFKNS